MIGTYIMCLITVWFQSPLTVSQEKIQAKCKVLDDQYMTVREGMTPILVDCSEDIKWLDQYRLDNTYLLMKEDSCE